MEWNRELALLSNAQMYQADSLTMELGISGARLMDQAARRIAHQLMAPSAAYPPPPGSTIILCGGGNNGGDGYVIAKYLREAGWPVDVAQFGATSDLPGDAALAAGQWMKDGETTVAPLGAGVISDASRLIDSVRGRGPAGPAARATPRRDPHRGPGPFRCRGTATPCQPGGGRSLTTSASGGIPANRYL